MSPEAPLIEARGLAVSYAAGRSLLTRRRAATIQAVSDVDVVVRKGEILAVVGESGCGKSTLGRALIRTVPLTAGRVLFRGRDVTQLGEPALRPLRRHFQMIFQDPLASLNPKMRVGETLAEPLRIHTNDAAREIAAKVAAMLVAVGLAPEAAGRFPHEFSGGQRQRVAIARAAILRPDFIVADEPLSALDVSLQLQILKLFDELRTRLFLTYFFISHDLARVFGFAERVAVMYLGKVVETGTTRTIFREPGHPYTQALLAAVPVPDPEVERTRNVTHLPGEVPSPASPPPGCRFHTRCPFAMPICRQREPRLRAIAAGQDVACHLHGES